MTCKVCSSDKARLKFGLTQKHQIWSCSNCRAEFMDPQLNDEEITRLYSENYYRSWGLACTAENESSRKMKIDTFLLRLKLIKNYVSSGKVLDVGCATGYFLEAAKEEGFEPFGAELSEYSSSISRSKFGEKNIFNGKLEDSPFSKGQFDVISMFDLIEHVRVPRESLAKAAELLNDKGVIIITTPNVASISNKMMGKKWTHYKQEHFYYLNLKSLEHIARECNLKVVYSEQSKKALNLDYLHTQFNVYRHWLFTPAVNLICAMLPKSLTKKNFHIGIGEITVILKK